MEQAKNAPRKGGRKALWAAVAVIAIAAAGAIGYKLTLEKTIASQLDKRGGKADSISADFLGRIHLTNVALPLKDGSDVRIASVEGRPKFLFLTGMLDASGVETGFANYRIAIPNLKIDGADFDISKLRETFGNSHLTLAERVSRFSAKTVAAPEINVVQTLAGKEQKVVYKDVQLNDIKQGHVARYSAGSASFDLDVNTLDAEGKSVNEQMTGTVGQTEAKGIDGVFLARLYTEKAGPDDKEPRPVYGPLSAKNIVVKSNQANVSYDEIRSQGFSMRMPEEPFSELVEKIAAVENPDDLTPAEQREFFLRLIALIDTIGKGDVEINGIKIDPTETDKQTGEIAKVTIAFDNKSMDASVKGISITKDADYLKADEASMRGFSWATTADALKKLSALSEDEAENFPFTTLMPEFGTLRVAGIDADLPNKQLADADDNEQAAEQDKSVVPERVQFSLKNYEVALKKPKNGIPTDIRVSYEDMSFPVPPSSQHELYEKLHKLGYDKVTLSSNVAVTWNEEKQDLVIEDISVSGQDMGRFAFSGLLGGFTDQMFSGDKVMTQVAALGIRPREAKLRIEEKGLIGKALKLYAEENDMSEEDARSALVMGATVFIQQVAADQPKLEQVATAFSAFLAKPNIFELTVKSKAEKGLGMLEMVSASQNPLLLLDKVDIEAKAE
ncbi:hypothetical protein AAIB41_05725 [Brucella sp. BE17]|uniref:hypothetical protein n=1 Tax=Brucella sp. BE17 TaxID=3142977 RepID=UPI0031B9CECA